MAILRLEAGAPSVALSALVAQALASSDQRVEFVSGLKRVAVSPAMLEALDILLRALAGHQQVTVVVGEADDLSSQEAADLLNVSRPFVTKLADQGVLAHHKVGTHRRFRLKDVLEYDRSMGESRREALAAIVPEEGYESGDF